MVRVVFDEISELHSSEPAEVGLQVVVGKTSIGSAHKESLLLEASFMGLEVSTLEFWAHEDLSAFIIVVHGEKFRIWYLKVDRKEGISLAFAGI